tara:strand:+ start:406 stop:1518 length:1113 start_codon:yes stop_codon:yes gene_type:complete
MSWIKIISINLAIFIGLIIMSELGLRILWTSYTCISRDCDFSRVSKIAVYEINNGFTEKNIGLSEPNSVLGYQPKPGFQRVIRATGWDSKLVSIDNNGYRSNGIAHDVEDLDVGSTILTVGDSFTFGDEVNNHETWPACIEKNTKRLTLNGGVFGYGSAQAVKRAWSITQTKKVDTIILSILLEDNFHRDQLKFRSGFPRPAVVLRDGIVSYAEVPQLDIIGTKWNPAKPKILLQKMKKYSMLFARVIDTFEAELTGMRRSEIHPEAASIDQIIEFTFKEFARLKVKNKFIVLQYSQNNIAEISTKVQQIKNSVTEISAKNNIPIIDTFKVLSQEYSNGEKKIWNRHHTAYGNILVCQEILNFILGKVSR